MAKKPVVKAVLNVRVPPYLHQMLKKLAVDTGNSSSSIIVQYLLWLHKFHYKHREVLNENTPNVDFKLDARKPRELRSRGNTNKKR